MIVINTLIYSIPLEFTIGFLFLRSPSFQEKRMIIVIIEDSLLVRFTPVSIKTRVFWVSSTNSVNTVDCSSQSPWLSRGCIDVVNEDILETVFTLASIIWVRHETNVPFTFRIGSSSSLEVISEHLSELSIVVVITRAGVSITLVISCGSSHYGFTCDDHPISEGNFIAVLLIGLDKSEFLNTRNDTCVVFIMEVDATIRASESGIYSVVHKIMSSHSQNAPCILSSWVVVVLNSGISGFVDVVDTCHNFIIVFLNKRGHSR
jgi:hypothetical protein